MTVTLLKKARVLKPEEVITPLALFELAAPKYAIDVRPRGVNRRRG
jgi:hypothetical protein